MTGQRPKLGWSDLRSARWRAVGVWGLGKEGHATVRKLRTLGVAPVLVDDSPNESGVLPTADGGLDALKQCRGRHQDPRHQPLRRPRRPNCARPG